jgi:Creatinase/Prolidase N-terminal domain
MDTPIAHNPIIVQRINALREAMQRESIHALLVPSSDPHLSEYLPERWKSREWLSGFTGSMGTLVITLEPCCLPIAAIGNKRNANWRALVSRCTKSNPV